MKAAPGSFRTFLYVKCDGIFGEVGGGILGYSDVYVAFKGTPPPVDLALEHITAHEQQKLRPKKNSNT